MDAERCVICGEIIPEGRMVCPICEKKAAQGIPTLQRQSIPGKAGFDQPARIQQDSSAALPELFRWKSLRCT